MAQVRADELSERNGGEVEGKDRARTVKAYLRYDGGQSTGLIFPTFKEKEHTYYSIA